MGQAYAQQKLTQQKNQGCEYIDNGTFAKLLPCAKSVLFVLKAKNEQYSGNVYMSVETISRLAGYGIRQTQYALAELEKAELIKRIFRPGRTTKYLIGQGKIRHIYPPNVREKAKSKQQPKVEIFQRPDWLPEATLIMLVNRHNSEYVAVRIREIQKDRGDIRDRIALLVASCRDGYIPVTRSIREANSQAVRRERSLEELKKKKDEAQEWERQQKEVEEIVTKKNKLSDEEKSQLRELAKEKIKQEALPENFVTETIISVYENMVLRERGFP